MLQISPFKQVLIVLACLLGLAFAMPNLFYSRVETHNDAVSVIEQGLTNPELEAASAAWIGLSVVGSPMLPIYISFFLSTETRATVQSARPVTAASNRGIPTIKVRTRGIRRIFPAGNLSASQKDAAHLVFPLQGGCRAA